jgi:hypothetical protein
MYDTAKRMMDAASTEALFAAAENALPGEARKATLLAAVRRLHYNASIAQGFSPEDALILCMDCLAQE